MTIMSIIIDRVTKIERSTMTPSSTELKMLPFPRHTSSFHYYFYYYYFYIYYSNFMIIFNIISKLNF